MGRAPSPITRSHAEVIASKLKASIDTSYRHHDFVKVTYRDQHICTFGLRRGSAANLPHPHIPGELGVSHRYALDMGRCNISGEEYFAKMLADGKIASPEAPLPEPEPPKVVKRSSHGKKSKR